MKTSVFLFIILVVVPFCALAQDKESPFPIVEYKQEHIEGVLPYGQRFIIRGSSKTPYGDYAEKVIVYITRADLKNQSDSSVWLKRLATDTTTFELFIGKPLPYNKNFELKFSFLRRISLSKEQKDKVGENIKEAIKDEFSAKGGISISEARKLIREEVKKAIAEASNYESDSLILQDGKIPPIYEKALKEIERESKEFALEIATDKAILILEDQLDDAKDKNDTVQIKDLEKEIADAKTRKVKASIDVPLSEIQNTLWDVYTVYAASSTDVSSATELNSIRIGTGFGIAATGLNFFEGSKKRDYDAFGYAVLKFYAFGPVDKRLVNPYLSGGGLNRLSILVGLSFKGDLNYRGSELKKIMGFYPVLGLSYDYDRWLSIDMGATAFKQDSISPLKGGASPKIAPILGINLDIDALNRLKALFVDKEKYKLSN